MTEDLGRRAVDQGLITPAQFDDCKAAIEAARAAGRELSFADVMLIKAYVTPVQLALLEAPEVNLELEPEPKQDPVPESAPVPAQASLGSYSLIEKIGESLFKVRKDNRVQVLRLLPKSTPMDELKKQAPKRVKFHHPHVAKIIAVGQIEGQPFITTEPVEGVDLQKKVEAHGALNGESISKIALQIAEALVALQAAGLKHGALRPSRVMQQPDGSIKLLDPAPVAEDDDLMLLGRVLFFLASGKMPGESETDPGAAISDELREIVRWLLSPEKKFSNAEDLLRALTPAKAVALPSRRPKKELPAPKEKKAPSFWDRYKIWIISGSAAAAFLAIIIGSAMFGGPSSRNQVKKPVIRDLEADPAVSLRVSEFCSQGRFAEALGMIDSSDLPDAEAAKLRERVQAGVLQSLDSVRAIARRRLATGDYAGAKQKWQEIQTTFARLSGVVAAADKEIAAVVELEKKNEETAIEEEFARVMHPVNRFIATNEWENAVQACREAESKATHPELKRRLAVQLAELRKGKPAAAAPSPDENDIAEAQRAFENGEWRRAEDGLSRVLQRSPNNPELLAMRARCLFELGRDSEASREASKAISANPREAEALYVLGAVTQKTDPRNAVDYFSQAINARRGMPHAYLRRAQCWLAAGQDEEAVKDAAEASRWNGAPEFYVECCKVLLPAFLRLKDYEGAAAQSAEWLRVDPNSKEAQDYRMQALRGLGRIEPVEAKKPTLEPQKPPEVKPAEAPKPPAAKPPAAKAPPPKPAKPTAKQERERKENVRKKLEQHFNAFQKKVDLLDDGRYRVHLLYDFAMDKDKQIEDFRLELANRAAGSVQFKKATGRDIAQMVWIGKIRGDFFLRAEYYVTEVDAVEVAGIFLGSAEGGDIKATGEGVGVRLLQVSALDLSEWRFELFKLAESPKVLTDPLNPRRVRHNARERCNLTIKRDGLTTTTQYGQAPALTGTVEGPDPNWLRFVALSCAIKLTKFEVVGYLDADYVNQVVPPPPPPPTAAPDVKTKPVEVASNPSGPLFKGSLEGWALTDPATVSADAGQLVLNGTEGGSAAMCDTAKFDQISLECRFRIDLMGDPFAVGIGLAAGTTDMYADGNIIVDLRNVENAIAVTFLLGEGGKGKVLASNGLRGQLKPGEYVLLVLVKDGKATASLNGVEVSKIDMPFKEAFRVGVFAQKGKVRVLALNASAP